MIRLTISSANSGLPPERSATWSTSAAPAPPPPGAGISVVTSARACSGASGSSVIRVALMRPPPQPGRRSSSSSRARHEQQHRAPRPAGQVLDQVEHALVGPMDVLDREDHRLASARRLDQGPDRREQAVAHLLRVLMLAGLGGLLRRRLDPQRPAERGRDPLRRLLGVRLGDEAGDPAVELAPGDVQRRRCRRSRRSRGPPPPAPSRRARRRMRGSCRAARPPAGRASRPGR